MKFKIFLSIFIFFSFVSNCNCEAYNSNKQKVEKTMITFKSVSMDEGLKLMSNDNGYVFLDVRTPEEYNEGHVPGALQLTNETFTKSDAEKIIPIKTQTVYVMCRSGRRSKMASQKLINFGYTNVIEIGGILDYKGPLEK